MAIDRSFLGRGWAFPPRFGANGSDVEMVAGEEDIRQSLQILLSTRLGERVMNEEFGCDLTVVLFEELDQSMVNTVQQVVNDAILYHEPRVDLLNLDVSESADEPGKLLINIEYAVRGTNSRYNMVYPFYLNEANVP